MLVHARLYIMLLPVKAHIFTTSSNSMMNVKVKFQDDNDKNVVFLLALKLTLLKQEHPLYNDGLDFK